MKRIITLLAMGFLAGCGSGSDSTTPAPVVSSNGKPVLSNLTITPATDNYLLNGRKRITLNFDCYDSANDFYTWFVEAKHSNGVQESVYIPDIACVSGKATYSLSASISTRDTFTYTVFVVDWAANTSNNVIATFTVQ